MATSTEPRREIQAPCPLCERPMRRERDGLRVPPMPTVFWFCSNVDCEDGRNNRLYSGG